MPIIAQSFVLLEFTYNVHSVIEELYMKQTCLQKIIFCCYSVIVVVMDNSDYLYLAIKVSCLIVEHGYCDTARAF